MSQTWAIFKREVGAYFSTPVAYVFIAIFLFLAGIFTFSFGGFFESRQADLNAFFMYHPWLYLFLIPAVSMRIWAEERSRGTVELLFTLPISLTAAVLGKFLAAWFFIGIALGLTWPIIWTVNYLGDPDAGVILTGYLGSFLMAGAYLAIGCCISAMTRNQVISFIISTVICFFFMLAEFPVVLDFFQSSPEWLREAVAATSFSNHFESIMRGLVRMTDIAFFLSMIVGWLFACSIVLDAKKAD